MSLASAPGVKPPAVARLQALYPLDDQASEALARAVRGARRVRPRSELIAEGQEIRKPLLLLSGWAAQICDLQDGRRQILHLLLPGDLIGLCDQPRPVATASAVALTGAELCDAPDRSVSPTLRQAYALSRAHEQARLLAQITRLGRMSAQERIADFLLELHDRLSFAGLVTGGTFPMPLTQEVVADVLGLTSVHVNRILQGLRKEGLVVWSGREVRLPEPARLRRLVARPPVRVSARW